MYVYSDELHVDSMVPSSTFSVLMNATNVIVADIGISIVANIDIHAYKYIFEFRLPIPKRDTAYIYTSMFNRWWRIKRSSHQYS